MTKKSASRMRTTIISVSGTRLARPSPSFLIRLMFTSFTMRAHRKGDIATSVTTAVMSRPQSGRISSMRGMNHDFEMSMMATMMAE